MPIVLKMPRNDNTDEFFVMVIHNPCDSLAFARPGDRAWTPILLTECNIKRKAFDVMGWDEIVLIMCTDGTFAYCDIGKTGDRDLALTPVKAKSYISVRNDIFARAIMSHESLYMVELGGDLLVISRHRECGIEYDDDDEIIKLWDSGDCYLTKDFEVYKHVHNTMLWEKVEDLGEFLLFVGHTSVIVVHVSKASSCQQNAIYFIDDERENYWETEEQKAREHDMGVFDMTTGEIRPFYQGDDKISEYFAPI